MVPPWASVSPSVRKSKLRSDSSLPRVMIMPVKALRELNKRNRIGLAYIGTKHSEMLILSLTKRVIRQVMLSELLLGFTVGF